jgi:trehalose 6-phosphate phosphatase
LEDKGLTVTFHARREPAKVPELEALAAGLASELGLVAQSGRMSVELRPPVLVDKGSVVEELTEGYRAACFMGDDVGDLPAFVALRRRREEGVATLAVAAASEEAPAELLEEADLVVDGPEGALGLLRDMAYA